ncbi:hypothetical protein D3C80_1749570 [compost metagenome]
MAAGVQQHHVAAGYLLQCGEHAVDVQVVVAIDVRIVGNLQSGGGEDALVDRPGRVAQPDAAARQAAGDELRRQTQGAGAAGGLGGVGALAGEQP